MPQWQAQLLNLLFCSHPRYQFGQGGQLFTNDLEDKENMM